jgi:hypothetical protein
MSIVGPWAVPVYKDKVNWGAVPVPTSTGTAADKTYTFSDAKNVGMYSSCKNQATVWDVLKFSTSKAQDGQLLNLTGQMPIRTDLPSAYPEYFKANPASSSVTRPLAPSRCPTCPTLSRYGRPSVTRTPSRSSSVRATSRRPSARPQTPSTSWSRLSSI